ncbi:MarR family winged helix-turn-helix transcriptional regulator [Butyricicoccus porcorum]|uniref:MarR family transcriptional regulator n=1 Tax=Butyricicoccus porcorum TaxID=1945634 RepID=A0A252F361_9FIRM|nr:MarR family transcriptional regulator [Butyricicoccus porcorum]MCI6925951.1 MarR family transcriptional regulator [Butyricicoccus porcorum]MDD6987904.1 MarR family transcriptional regulator [Butyricicoccus porcorum]MDY4484029.1 MarR family transcriptional regulator [Butyricicoccus porcorum]OUM20248.1 MarR family transcriptional regulator [Butyricicoccus porcorum]
MTDQNSCGMLLKQINDELEKRANNKLRAQDLTMAQLCALMMLNQASERQMTLKELERKLHVAQSTAAGIITRLEQKGFVEGFGDAADRRIKMVRITKLGIQCCMTAEKNMEQEEATLLSGLTDTERIVFISLLQKVRNTLS